MCRLKSGAPSFHQTGLRSPKHAWHRPHRHERGLRPRHPPLCARRRRLCVGSIWWTIVGLTSGQTSLIVANGFLTFVNLVGIWRWLGRQRAHEDGARSATIASRKAPGPSLFYRFRDCRHARRGSRWHFARKSSRCPYRMSFRRSELRGCGKQRDFWSRRSFAPRSCQRHRVRLRCAGAEDFQKRSQKNRGHLKMKIGLPPLPFELALENE